MFRLQCKTINTGQENASLQGHSNPTTVGTENCNIAEVQDKDLKIAFDYARGPFGGND